MSRVVVVGQGYVGVPVALEAVRAGHEVVGFDTNPYRIERLREGSSYVEDVADGELCAALGSGRYTQSAEPADCKAFDVAVITVPTPLTNGAPDLSCIEEAARLLAEHVRPRSTVVLESTTYPGTTEELVGPILEAGSGLTPGADFHLGYSPERIDPGSEWGLRRTPKVVSGVDAPSLAAVQRFYEGFVEQTVPVGSTRVAELTKLLENTFRHVNIALVNELAMFAHDLGIDIWEAIDAASTKPFGYMRFEPGPGAGGHCLPVDPSYLSWDVRRRLGQSFRFVELANEVNRYMPFYVVRRVGVALERRGCALEESRLLLLGLAYKPNTSDARESPAAVVAGLFAERGAQVRVADPHVGPSVLADTVTRVDATPGELAAADAVVLLVDHDAFDHAAVREHARYVFDARNRLGSVGNVEVL